MDKHRNHTSEMLSFDLITVSVRLLILCLLTAGFFQSIAHAAWQPVQFSDQVVANSGDYGRWWQTWNDVTGSALVNINDVYIDSENRILSTGYIDDGVGSVDLYVARHDSDGTLMWEDVFDGGLSDEAFSIFQDPGGNVLVVGASDADSETNVIVLKYSLDGIRLWTQLDNITGSTHDVRAAMGASGGIYVAATHNIDGFFNKDIVLLKYDTSSDTAGSVTELGSYGSSTEGGAAAVADIAMAPDGTIVIAGTSDESTKDIVVLKYNPDGSVPVAWAGGVLSSVKFPDWSANDYASALYVNAAGDIYVAGWTYHDCSGGFGQGKHNLIVLKLGADASLPPAWTVPACHISDLGFITPRDIVVDGSDNIFVAGQVGVDIDADTLLVSFDNQGGKRWVRRLDVGNGDVLEELVQSPSGDLIAVGSGNHDALLVQYGADGTLKSSFVEDYSGVGENANDNAAAVAIGQDSYGNPAVIIGGGSALDVQSKGKLFLRAYSELRADLQPDNSIVAPAVGGFESTIPITNSVTNLQNATQQNLADAGTFVVGLYLWSDGLASEPVIGDPNLIYLGQRTVNGLQSGQQDSDVTYVTVPSPTTSTIIAGQYHVVVIADINNSVAEYDQANNVLKDPNIINIFDPPDLQPLSVSSAFSTASAAATIPVDYVVENNRSVAASGFVVGFFLSSNTVIGDGDDIQLQGTGTVSGLAGNTILDTQVGGGTVSVTIPNDITPGLYHLGVNVDINNAVVEAFEDNNVYLDTATVIDVKAIPDLSVQSLSGPLGAVTGGSIDVDTTVTNAATAGDATQAFTVSAYLSEDDVITTSDHLLGSRTVPVNLGISLGAGLTDNDIVSGLVPSALTPGSYYLGAVVDSADAITENNEANNSAVSSDKITIGLPDTDVNALPDLLVTDVSIITAPPYSRGDQIQVSTTIQNVLPKDIPSTTPFRVGIYLSTDPNITTSDKLVGERFINGLAGNTVDTKTDLLVDIPGDLVEDAQWTNVVNATVQTDNTLKSTAGNAGASSVQQIDGDGAVESVVKEKGTNRAFGMSLSDSTQTTEDFSYAFQLYFDWRIFIWEKNPSGTQDYINTGLLYNTGDKLRIERTAGEVSYKLNGAVIHVSPYPSSGSVVLDTSIGSVNATISQAKVIQVQLVAGTYYLGAIVDDEDTGAGIGVVTEVDESNNAQVQTDTAGVASSTVLSVQSGQGNSARGGGSMSLFGLFLLLMSIVGMYRLERNRIVVV